MTAKHGQLTTVGAGGSSESCVWTCKAHQLGKALGLVADMPTLPSSPESEYRSTDRGSGARREEEAKEHRCPSDVEGVIGRLLNTEGTLRAVPRTALPQEGLGHRPQGSQASESLVSASRENRTQCQTPARETIQSSGIEHETEPEVAKTRNMQAPQSQAALDKACEKVISDKPGVNLLQTSVEKWPVPYDQNKVRNVLLQQFQAFQTQLALHTSSAPSGRGQDGGREA